MSSPFSTIATITPSSLSQYLKNGDINARDSQGFTLLHHAAIIGRHEIVETLLENGALHRVESSFGFTPLDEAIDHGHKECIAGLLFHIYRRNLKKFHDHIEALYEHVEALPDAKIEINWQFRTWIPLVSRMCPSDTFKVYKQGRNVRMDVTLIGFDKMKWQRGDVSFVFTDKLYIIDRNAHTYGDMLEPMESMTREKAMEEAKSMLSSKGKKNQPKAISTDLDTRGVTYERKKAWMSGYDVVEKVSGYDCSVYECKGLSFGVKWRKPRNKMSDASSSSSSGVRDYDEDIDMEEVRQQLQEEHAPDTQIDGHTDPHIDQSTLDDHTDETDPHGAADETDHTDPHTHLGHTDAHGGDDGVDDPHGVDDAHGVDERDIEPVVDKCSSDEPVVDKCSDDNIVDDDEFQDAASDVESEESDVFYDAEEEISERHPTNAQTQGFTRSVKFKLWLSDDFPVSFDDFLPIFQVLAPTSTHFEKLQSFLSLRLPPGFPVKVEIPVFPALSAVVTFCNFSRDVDLDDDFFSIPDGYEYKRVDESDDEDE